MRILLTVICIKPFNNTLYISRHPSGHDCQGPTRNILPRPKHVYHYEHDNKESGQFRQILIVPSTIALVYKRTSLHCYYVTPVLHIFTG